MIFITDNDSLHLAFALILHLHLALGIVPILTDDPRRESDSPVAFVLEGPEVHSAIGGHGPWPLQGPRTPPETIYDKIYDKKTLSMI